MATRFIESSFREQVIPGASGERIPINVTELIGPRAAGSWSAGGALIDNIEPPAAPLGQVWAFLGWSITLTPFIRTDPEGANPFAVTGRLGQIIGGLTFAKATPTLFDQPLYPSGLFEQPWTEPMPNLPTNTFGLDVIWDGRTDTTPPTGTALVLPPVLDIPPTYSEAPGLQPILVNYALPVPVQIYPGQTMQIGLWITPSQADNFGLAVTGASYVVVVDDGQPQVTTWGRDLATELAH